MTWQPRDPEPTLADLLDVAEDLAGDALSPEQIAFATGDPSFLRPARATLGTLASTTRTETTT